jgi:hypothetical protein
VADRPDDSKGSGISVSTLIVASAASAVATFVVSRVWGPGTLIGAAATPIIVALVSEGLRRPAKQVTVTARRVVPVSRIRQRPGGAHGEPRPREEIPPEAVREGIELEVTRRDYSVAPRIARRHWRLAVATGLAAFGIVVAVYTVPDLIAGKSISGRGSRSTLFGGHRSHHEPKTTTTTTTTTPTTTTPATTTPTQTTTTQTTPTVTVTTTVPATPTVPPTETTPPAQTEPPATTTTVPPGG